MKYILKFKEISIGTICSKDSDFLNLWGTLDRELPLESRENERQRLIEFIKLSIRESDLVEDDDLHDLTSEYEQLNTEFESYMDFVESDQWTLVSEQGDIQNILVPSFKSDNTIVWCWKI